MRYPRIYKFLCKAQKDSKRYDCEKFALRAGYPFKKLMKNVLPTNGWAIPIAALPLIILTVYKCGYISGVPHQSSTITELYFAFSLVFLLLYLKLGGLCRYYALIYFMGKRKPK